MTPARIGKHVINLDQVVCFREEDDGDVEVVFAIGLTRRDGGGEPYTILLRGDEAKEAKSYMSKQGALDPASVPKPQGI